jgi:hypothetical protein
MGPHVAQRGGSLKKKKPMGEMCHIISLARPMTWLDVSFGPKNRRKYHLRLLRIV